MMMMHDEDGNYPGPCEDAPCCGCCGQLDASPDFHEIQNDINEDFCRHEYAAMTEEEAAAEYHPAEDAHLDSEFEDRFFCGE